MGGGIESPDPLQGNILVKNLIIEELKDLRRALTNAVGKFETDIGNLYDRVEKLKDRIHDSGGDENVVKELNEWKKDFQKILTIDDLKNLKDESQKSRDFRIKIIAYSGSVSLVVACIWKLIELAVTAHGGK